MHNFDPLRAVRSPVSVNNSRPKPAKFRLIEAIIPGSGISTGRMPAGCQRTVIGISQPEVPRPKSRVYACKLLERVLTAGS